MKRDEVISWLRSRGYDLTPLSRKGATKNLYFVHPEKDTIRYVVSKIAIRYERKYDAADGVNWFRARSGYFKNLSLNDKNQLVGMK